MSDYANPYQSFGLAAADATADARARFIRLTYLHLAGAVLAFLALEAVLLPTLGEPMLDALSGTRWGGMIMFGAFMLVSYVAQSWAQSSTSKVTQYMGLGLYVLAEALFLAPLLFLAERFKGDPNFPIIPTAAFLTLFIFGSLTAVVLMSGANFSFLGSTLRVASFAALAYFICSAIFGFNLGLFFISAMVLFAAAYILYGTSAVLHDFRTDQYVAASLLLFASVALLFLYLIQLLMSLQSRD